MKRAIPYALALVVLGCGTRSLPPSEYMRYLSDTDNGLVQERLFEDVSLRLQYRTPEAVILPFLPDSGAADSASSFRASQKGAFHFNLRFMAHHAHDLLFAGSASQEEYYRRQQYFAEEVINDLWLVVGGDTLPCAMAHFERTYGVVPFNELVISFVDDGSVQVREDLHLIYDDQAFGLGPIEFRVRKEDIASIPPLQLS